MEGSEEDAPALATRVLTTQSEPRPSGSGPSENPHIPPPDPRAQLDAAIRWHVLFHTQRREEAFVSHSEMRSLTPENLARILAVRERYDQLFSDILLRCQRDGIIREMSRDDTRVLRNAILTMCTATAGWFNPAGRLSAEQIAEQIARFILAGLRPAHGS